MTMTQRNSNSNNQQAAATPALPSTYRAVAGGGFAQRGSSGQLNTEQTGYHFPGVTKNLQDAAALGAGIPAPARRPNGAQPVTPGVNAQTATGGATAYSASATDRKPVLRPTPGTKPYQGPRVIGGGGVKNAGEVPTISGPGKPMSASGKTANAPTSALTPGQHEMNTSAIQPPAHDEQGFAVHDLDADLRAGVPSMAHLPFGIRREDTQRGLTSQELQRVIGHARGGCPTCQAFVRGHNAGLALAQAAAARRNRTTPAEQRRLIADARTRAVREVKQLEHENQTEYIARLAKAAGDAEIAERRRLGLL